jgi:hypothetical protein
VVIVVVHVDNLLLAGPTIVELDDSVDSLETKFELKRLGTAQRFLGLEIARDCSKTTIWIG